MQTLSWVILKICQETVCRDQGDVQVGPLRDPCHLGPRCRPLGLPLDPGRLPDRRPQMPVVFSPSFPNSPSCPSFSASYSTCIFPGSFSAFSGTARALWADEAVWAPCLHPSAGGGPWVDCLISSVDLPVKGDNNVFFPGSF